MVNLLLNTMKRDIEYLEAHGDMEDAQTKRNELELYVLFPDARFIIDGDFLPMLDDLLTEEKHIFLSHTRYCCCWDEEEYKPTEFSRHPLVLLPTVAFPSPCSFRLSIRQRVSAS